MTNATKTFFNIFCIDKRFDALTTEYFQQIGFTTNYYLGTTAGSALPLGFDQYCSEIYSCSGSCSSCVSGNCNPEVRPTMELLKNSLITNIKISQTLDDIKEIYLLNHQDCGAIKAFLPCSEYPNNLGENNTLEIKINQDLLLFAKDYLNKEFPEISVRLGLIDYNGSVADFNVEFNSWKLKYRGLEDDPRALWFGYENFTI
jgi:hypothetical protein